MNSETNTYEAHPNGDTPQDRLIGLPEASVLTGLAQATLRNAERRGVIPGFRPLGRLRFRLSDVVKWIEASRSTPRKAPPPELLLHRERRTSRRRR